MSATGQTQSESDTQAYSSSGSTAQTTSSGVSDGLSGSVSAGVPGVVSGSVGASHTESSGVADTGLFRETPEGTLQGGILSPLPYWPISICTNLTCDGNGSSEIPGKGRNAADKGRAMPC